MLNISNSLQGALQMAKSVIESVQIKGVGFAHVIKAWRMEKDKAELKPIVSKPFNELRKPAEELLDQRVEELQSKGGDDIRNLVHELRVYQIELEAQNEELRRTQVELEESRQRYVDLYDHAPVGYLTFDPQGLVFEANLTSANLVGVERRWLIKRKLSEFIASESQDLFYLHCKRVFKTRSKQTCELQFEKKDGTPLYALLESTAVPDVDGNFDRIHTTITDISARKLAEETLRQAHENLKIEAENRTLELKTTAKELKYRQEELLSHKSELEKVNKELLETNKAISVLARNIDKNRQETENTIAKTISSRIMPIIEDLRKTNTSDSIHSGLDILATHLQTLSSELIGDMNIMVYLTPTEMRVATMIKNGLTSRDIAKKLYISLHTTKTHRRNIRKKLNVQNSSINLASYLRSLMW